MTRREILFSGVYLVFELWLLPGLLTAVNIALGSPWSPAAVNFLYFLLNFTAMIVILRQFLLASAKDALRRPVPILIHALLGTAGYYSMTSLLTRLLLILEPGFSNVNDASLSLIARQEFLLMAAGTVLLVPLTEECLFRGLLFGAVRKHSRAAAWILSMALFAAIHVIAYIGKYPARLLALCFLQYLPAGFCIAWCYAKADNIFTPILIHTAVNAMGMAAMR